MARDEEFGLESVSARKGPWHEDQRNAVYVGGGATSRGNGAAGEAEELDYKRTYPAGDKGANGIAVDIATFANHRGGVIVIGMDEMNTRPAAIVPVELTDEFERQIHIAAADAGYQRSRPSNPYYVHLTVCLAPESSGDLIIDRAAFDRFNADLKSDSLLIGHNASVGAWQAGVGQRCLVASCPPGRLDLHSDGGRCPPFPVS